MDLLIFLLGAAVGTVLTVGIALWAPMKPKRTQLQGHAYMDPAMVYWTKRKMAEAQFDVRNMPLQDYIALRQSHGFMATTKSKETH